MVHIIAKPQGLRIKKDPVARYKLPGVCGAVTGCVLFIIGLGIGIVGYSNTSKDDKETAKSLKVVGPILCIVGIAMFVAGFTYKYVMHQRYKDLRKDKYILRPKSGRSTRSARSARSAKSARTTRAARPASRSPGDGSSQIVSDDMHYHLEELGLEIGESSSPPDMFVTKGSARQDNQETEFDSDVALRMPKTTDASKVKSSRPKSGKSLPNYGTYSEGYVNEAYNGPLPEEANAPKDIFESDVSDTAPPSVHSLPPIKKEIKKKGKKRSPRSPRPDSGAKQRTPRDTADGTEQVPKIAEHNNNTEVSLERSGLDHCELAPSVHEIPKELTYITRRSKFSRRETLALHEEADVEEIPDLSLAEGVLMNVSKLPTITIEEEEEDFEYDF